MKTIRAQNAKAPAALARRLFKLERCGKYEEALEELADIWPDFRLKPNIDGLKDEESAEILLRCGSLIGLYGHNAQVPDAQIQSKNLLTEARESFLHLAMIEKAAECENHLAFAFWRTGEFNEAENWIDEALGRALPDSSDARLYSHLIKSLIDLSCKRHDENVKRGSEMEAAFRTHGDAFLNGSFYTNVGLSLKNLGKFSEALGYLELAKHYHRRSRHKIYLGTVENNLAQLYQQTGKFAKAHESIDNATRLFRQLKDRTREGYSLDTKALVYFAESKYTEALRTVEKGLAILEKTENTAYRIDTLLTKAKILLFLDNFLDAVICLIDAVNLARVQTGEAAAKRVVEEFEAAFRSKNEPPKKNLESNDFELIMPESIGHFSDYRGIWINNTRLTEVGLVKGSLAIVVKAKVKRGDLIAVAEVESGEVSCGFYDADFGIVCLEGSSGEPQIYDENEIRILGKIIGVCNADKKEDGKMFVQTLTV